MAKQHLSMFLQVGNMISLAVTGKRYLERMTGVHGRSWLVYSGYLLINEAQTTYSDSSLWSSYFKIIEPWCGGPRVMLFSAHFCTEDRETKKALEYINYIGWLHEEKTKEGRRRFVFASPIHRW